MKYLPRAKGAKLGLYNENGFAPILPKGIKVRFDIIGVPASFQFFDGKKAISPIMVQIEDDDDDFSFIATLKTGEKKTINVKQQTISNAYLEKLDNIYIGLEGEILLDDMSGKPEPYFLDKRRFKMAFENSYLLRSLIGVKNREGKCAIFDTYSKKLITDFVLDPDNYGFAGALNLETQTTLRSYYVIHTTPDTKEGIDANAQKFVIASDDGQFVTDFVADKFLWQQNHIEKKPNGAEVEYSYSAFAKKAEDGTLQTRVLKLNLETGKLEQVYQVPLIADKPTQHVGSFMFTNDDRIVLLTQSPETQASKGAYALNADGSVETILKNVNTEIEYTHHYQKGRFLTFKNAETVGKIALDGKSRTFEVSKTEFAELAKRYFGASSPSELRPKLQPVPEQTEQAPKKKPSGGTGPTGGSGPNGGTFGG